MPSERYFTNAWRAVSIGAATALLFFLTIDVASADTPAPAQAKAEADRVMRLSYIDFINYKNQSYHPFAFDFSSDGCSSGVPPQEFEQPCELHDFGYRNYGQHGFQLGRDDQTKLWIDNRLHEEADRECNINHAGFAEQGNNRVCHYQAQVMFNGLQTGIARSAFYEG